MYDFIPTSGNGVSLSVTRGKNERCERVPGASGAIKSAVLIFAVIFCSFFLMEKQHRTFRYRISIDTRRLTANRAVNRLHTLPRRRIFSCRQFRAIDPSIRPSIAAPKKTCAYGFTRARTCRHVRATRTGPIPFNYRAQSELSRSLKEINCRCDVRASGFDRTHDGSSRNTPDGEKMPAKKQAVSRATTTRITIPRYARVFMRNSTSIFSRVFARNGKMQIVVLYLCAVVRSLLYAFTYFIFILNLLHVFYIYIKGRGMGLFTHVILTYVLSWIFISLSLSLKLSLKTSL